MKNKIIAAIAGFMFMSPAQAYDMDKGSVLEILTHERNMVVTAAMLMGASNVIGVGDNDLKSIIGIQWSYGKSLDDQVKALGGKGMTTDDLMMSLDTLDQIDKESHPDPGVQM